MAAALTVRRACAIGACASRGEVEHWLSGVPIEQLGLAADEILYVPRLRARVPPGRGRARIADQILGALRAELARADSGWGERFVPGRAYRFRGRPAYCAGLIGLLLPGTSVEARDAFAAATGETSLARWQRRAVLGDGPLLIGTVVRLAEIGGAARWIATFEPGDVALATRSIAAAFGVRLDPPGTSPPLPPSYQRAAPGTAARRAHEAIGKADAHLAARGNEWRDLPPPHRALLLAAVTLAHTPSRSADPAAVLATAIAVRAAPTISAEPPAFEATIPLVGPSPPAPAPIGNPPAARLLTHAPVASMTDSSVAQRGSRRIGKAPATDPVASFTDRLPQRRGTAHERIEAETHVPPIVPAPSAPLLAAIARTPGRTIASSLLPEMTFGTEYGGLLFLLNAFVALGLYPDFTQPQGARLDPSPLWLADRIGRYWFGARYARDPLGRWCAAHTAVGVLPREWHAPQDWLDGFGTARSPRVIRRRNRVTLWHPDGFPLRDATRYRPPPRTRMLARAPRRLPLARSDRWAACLALYLDARLCRMTGAGLDLLARAARVRLYDLDLSATFDLARHPIELRLAGLDRNPGWQPAEARRVAFDFA